MAKQEINPNIILIAAAAGLVYFGGSKLASLFSFGNSEEDKANSAALKQLQNSNVLSPNYYKQIPYAHLLTMASAESLAKIIYDAKGIFNDDEAAVYGVFQQLSYKTQVSFLSEVFFTKYKVSLLGFIQNFFNEAELATVANIVNKLQ
jgi:hypothetical protein